MNRYLLLIAIVCISTFSRTNIVIAETMFKPLLTISEEYTDNAGESHISSREDFITRVLPGFYLEHKASRWDISSNYIMDYRHYARGVRDDELTHDLNAKFSSELIANLFYLNITDIYKKVSLDVTRDTTYESLSYNQSDKNELVVNPYFTFFKRSRTPVQAGYRHRNVWYKSDEGIDLQEHSGYLKASYEMSKYFFMLADYDFIRTESEFSKYDRQVVSGGFNYELAEDSFLFANLGNSWINYDSGDKESRLYWDIGLNYKLNNTNFLLKSGVKYNSDPKNLSDEEMYATATVSQKFDRFSAGLNFLASDYYNVKTDETTTFKYGSSIDLSYQAREVLKFTCSAGFEKFEIKYAKTHTNRWLAGMGADYQLNKHIFLALNYKYADYTSPGITADNKTINRIILDARVVF